MTLSPFAVICKEHGRQLLTEKQYLDQLCRPYNRWYCPVCTDVAVWDDDWYEEHLDPALAMLADGKGEELSTNA